MNAPEKRVMQVSDMIGTALIESVLQFRHGAGEIPDMLWDAQQLLDPQIKQLEKCIRKVLQRYGLDDALLNALTNERSRASYVVGILAGLHLAGRSDLVPKPARAYGETTSDRAYADFDEDGGWADRGELKH